MTNSIETRQDLLTFLLEAQNCLENVHFLYVVLKKKPNGFFIETEATGQVTASSAISADMRSLVVDLVEHEEKSAQDFGTGFTNLMPALLNGYPETECGNYEVLQALLNWASLFNSHLDGDTFLRFDKRQNSGEVTLYDDGGENMYEFVIPSSMFACMESALSKSKPYDDGVKSISALMRPDKLAAFLSEESEAVA